MVGDDDSSAIKRLRTDVYEDVAKSSDLNHVKKNLGNSLYRQKQSGHKELSDMVINRGETIIPNTRVLARLFSTDRVLGKSSSIRKRA